MGKPCSMDLRERVVRAVEEEGQSRRQAAARFGVSYSAAIEWVKRYRQTGTFKPGKIGGHKLKVPKMAPSIDTMSPIAAPCRNSGDSPGVLLKSNMAAPQRGHSRRCQKALGGSNRP